MKIRQLTCLVLLVLNKFVSYPFTIEIRQLTVQTKHIKMFGTTNCLHLDIICKLAHCVQNAADPSSTQSHEPITHILLSFVIGLIVVPNGHCSQCLAITFRSVCHVSLLLSLLKLV